MKTRTIKPTVITTIATLALALAPSIPQAGEITVPSDSILTIQEAVDAAAPGDTILVMPGTYGPVTIGPQGHGLRLKAVGPPGSIKVVGFGDLFWNVGIDIQADDVSVEGFEVSNATDGIRAVATSHGVKIAGNRIGSLPGPNSSGVRIETSAGVEVSGNTFFGSVAGEGITVYQCASIHVHNNDAGNSSIADNFITITGSTGCELDHNRTDGAGTGASGIFLNGWAPAGANTQHHIHHNQMNNAAQGIFAWLSPGCVMDNNVCDDNTQFGIYLASSDACTLEHNQAGGNGVAGLVWGSSNCKASYNVADGNGLYGIAAGGCGNAFAHNAAEANGQWDLFAPGWDTPADCNTYLDNRATTALPSLELWDVK